MPRSATSWVLNELKTLRKGDSPCVRFFLFMIASQAVKNTSSIKELFATSGIKYHLDSLGFLCSRQYWLD